VQVTPPPEQAGIRSIVILGAGRQALETSGYCAELGIDVAYFLEDCPPRDERDEAVFGAPILQFDEYDASAQSISAIAAVGDPDTRRHLVERWSGPPFVTVVSQHAWLAADTSVGAGSTVAPRASLNRLVQIGSHVLVNVGAVLSHDVEVGDFVTIGPSCTVGGCVRIGAGAFLGIGSTVRDHITIGRDAVVGAGAVVVDDVPEGVTVAGVPARPMLDRRPW
jgi:sugar O-acyltransferase (sialic acid O-acetyltransferase NeuD family)